MVLCCSCLRAHVRSNAEICEEIRVCDGLQKATKIAAFAPVERSFHVLVIVPEDVDLDHVESAVHCALHDVRPFTRSASGIMYRSAYEQGRNVVQCDSARRVGGFIRFTGEIGITQIIIGSQRAG